MDYLEIPTLVQHQYYLRVSSILIIQSRPELTLNMQYADGELVVLQISMVAKCKHH